MIFFARNEEKSEKRPAPPTFPKGVWQYEVSLKGAISMRFSERTETVKTVANQIVATERALELLNVSEQIAARSLADELKSISTHLAGAARCGACCSSQGGGRVRGTDVSA
jgi:hypothetical protein